MKEIFKNNAYKVLELFIEHPTKNFSIREIAREIGVSHGTIITHMKNLFKTGLVKKNKDTLYPTYYADTESEQYRMLKKNHIAYKIIESGLIDFLQKETLASSIILFGSCANGTYTEKSDIDIFVESTETEISTKKYEKSLNKKINLLFEARISDLQKGLRNNVLNGIVLYGLIRI